MAKKKKIIKKKIISKPKKIIKKSSAKKVIEKRIISTQEKQAKNKLYYVRRKNKKFLSKIEDLNKLDGRKYINFEGKKRKPKTVKNILLNEITKNNTKIEKSIKALEKKFKKKIRPSKRKPKSKFGILKSPPYLAWESKQAKEWINKYAGNDFNLVQHYMRIDAITILMTSNDVFIMTYNRGTKEFDCFIELI